MRKDKGVLVIYTGGTIGSTPSEGGGLAPVGWKRLLAASPGLRALSERFPVDSVSFDPPVDSADMRPGRWVELAGIIEENYEKYNGFVVLHGTDTMVYTASALSFMLAGLAKPVVLTGSQLPVICNPRNDGEQNLVTGLMIANGPFFGLPVVPEVCVYFRDRLLRGNRARKLSTSGFIGFDSPNCPLLAKAGEHIRVDPSHLLPPGGPLSVRKGLDPNVITFRIFPGVQSSGLAARILSLEGLRGVVLETYGAGNAPTDPRFLDEIEKAVKAGVVIVNVTQCIQGSVEPGVYATGKTLAERGVLSGADMTSEAALCKLMVLLAAPPAADSVGIGDALRKSLAGELTVW